MTSHDLIQMALRVVLVYLCLVVALRLAGKWRAAGAGALDLVLALVVGQVVAAPLLGEVPVLPALALIAMLVGIHRLTAYLTCHSETLDGALHGTPRTLIRHGQLVHKALGAEAVSLEELARMLREHGVEMLSEVKLATLERDGRLTVLKADGAREAQRSDLRGLLNGITGGEEEPVKPPQGRGLR